MHDLDNYNIYGTHPNIVLWSPGLQHKIRVMQLGSKETVVQMAKANGVRWYVHVLRKVFEVKGKRKRGRPKKTWKTQVEESKSWFLQKGCHELSEIESGSWSNCCHSRVNLATPIYRDKPRSNWIDWISFCPMFYLVTCVKQPTYQSKSCFIIPFSWTWNIN